MTFSQLIQFFKKNLSSLVLWSFFALSILVLVLPQLRSYWKQHFALPEREVLAVASGAIFKDGRIHRVVKVLTPQGILVEIYGPLDKGTQPLIDTILIPDKRDAYFDLHGRATNLALKDMDADGRPEIIAPSYDSDGIAHLNVYTYNSDTNKFLPYLE